MSLHPSQDVPVQEEGAERNVQTGAKTTTTTTERAEPQENKRDPFEVALPEIPKIGLDLNFSIFVDPFTPAEAESAEFEKVQKRASNVMKLAQENENLKAELKAMTDRLEAAERRREQMTRKEQTILTKPSS